ncbi:hypothetical protein EDB84DRAFT_1434866 [Lactarius hengduanensis]|nr:hypothetical protein EDB84DRAFT_1434866 [Lactarius hengduanensis]
MCTTGVDLCLHQISKEQHRAASDYLSGPLPESPHYGGTSFGVMVPNPLLPFERLGSAYIEAVLGTGDPASTPSASLAQDYDPSPVSTTFQTGAHQPGPPSSWPSQINGTTTSATTTPGDPKQCPACSAHFNRRQDCDRHIETHLPHWIHCSFPNCTWRGNRVKPFKIHWETDHGSHGHNIPGREQFEIFNTQEFVNQIRAGTPLLVVADRAIERVRARAHQLGKMSMSTNPWGWTFKQPPQ